MTHHINTYRVTVSTPEGDQHMTIAAASDDQAYARAQVQVAIGMRWRVWHNADLKVVSVEIAGSEFE